MAKRSKLLDEREKTHGDFESNSEAYARLLDAIPLERYPRLLRYAINGIYLKLARMASGHGMFPGHSEDIKGYADLIHQYVLKETRQWPRTKPASRTRSSRS